MLNPRATNRMTCSVCGWTQILDPLAGYPGGHPHAGTGAACHEMINYTEEAPAPPFEPEVTPPVVTQDPVQPASRPRTRKGK